MPVSIALGFMILIFFAMAASYCFLKQEKLQLIMRLDIYIGFLRDFIELLHKL